MTTEATGANLSCGGALVLSSGCDLLQVLADQTKYITICAYDDLASARSSDAAVGLVSDVPSRASLSINLITAEKSSSLPSLSSAIFI